MTTQADYEQFTARVKDELGRRLEWVSLRLLDVGLIKGDGEDKYIFVGWANHPITRHTAQFSLDFTAEISAGTDVDGLVEKLAGQVVEYFHKPQIIVPR